MIRTESYKKGTLISMGLNVISKGIAFAITLVITYYFGISVETDLYYYIMTAGILVSGIINGIDLLVLIPEAVRIRRQENEQKSQQFLNFFIYLYFFIGLIFAALTFINPVFLFSTISNFDTALLQSNHTMLYIGGLFIFFQLLNSLLSSILVSYKFFTITIVASIINSTLAILLTFALHGKIGINGTLLGLMTGFIVNLIFLVSMMRKQLNWRFNKVIFLKDRTIWKNIGLMQVNILPVWLRNSITLYLISSLGSGTITTVNLAMQIISIVDIFFVSQILSTSGIKFNELVAARDYVTLNSIFIKVSKVIFMVIFPLVAIIFFYHSQIVSILFVRGKFDRESAATLGVCITFLIFLCPLSAINSLGTRLISSFQQIDKTILISITTHIVFLILTYVLTNNMGLLGYLISSIIGYFLLTSAFYLLFTIYFKFISFNDLLKDCVIQFVLNFLIALFFRAAVMDIISNDLTMLFCATFIQIAAVTMFNYKFILKVYK